MSLNRREFLRLASLGSLGLFLEGCSPDSRISPTEDPTPVQMRAPAIATPEGNLPKLEPLWERDSGTEILFSSRYEYLWSEEFIVESNVEPGVYIYLKDPNDLSQKPFYDTLDHPYDVGPSYGKVVTFYEENEVSGTLWPLAQEYETLNFLNVFLMGGYADIPQLAKTLKPGGKVMAQARVSDIFIKN